MALRDSVISSISLLSVTCFLLFVLILYYILPPVISPLRTLSGPLFARFTRLWYLKNVWDGKFEQVNVALHKEYGTIEYPYGRGLILCNTPRVGLLTEDLGPIVRIAPNEYSIDDAEAVKIIYGHGAGFIKVLYILS